MNHSTASDFSCGSMYDGYSRKWCRRPCGRTNGNTRKFSSFKSCLAKTVSVRMLQMQQFSCNTLQMAKTKFIKHRGQGNIIYQEKVSFLNLSSQLPNMNATPIDHICKAQTASADSGHKRLV
ncbi:hypothetical protein C1H46_037135 [Malus baccata]|uniref:Uncharacterized protein n=1 Tax=Malus baccata TaxID=106549 RepID=A0A540KTG7_MALBA|nr:hypothetical protein C1H46_037135 [Malus baccata]